MIPLQSAGKVFQLYTSAQNRTEVEEGWTDKLVEIIWEARHLPCCFAFKRARHRTTDIICEGYCSQKDCHVKITATLPHRSDNLLVLIENFDKSLIHDPKIKRRIDLKKKMDLICKLKQSSAYSVESELADAAMSNNCPMPAHVPSKNALRIIKSRSQCPSDHNAILAIENLRNVYPNCIQNSGSNPFFVFYSTDLQKAWYKSEAGRKRLVISIDASGIGVRSPTSNTKYIFLYVICAHGNFLPHIIQIIYFTYFIQIIYFLGVHKSVPVAQMLSQDHTTTFISFWLTKWVKDNKKPSEVIVDASNALIGACVQAFTQYRNLNAYLTGCMNALLYDKEQPECFIRIDRSHFVRSLLRNKQLAKEDQRTRNMIRGILGYLIQCECIQTVENVLRNTFILTKSPYVTETVSTSHKFLTDLVAKHDFIHFHKETEKNEDDVQKEEVIDNSTYKHTSIYKWIVKIYDSIVVDVDANDNNEFENLYCSKKLNTFFYSPTDVEQCDVLQI